MFEDYDCIILAGGLGTRLSAVVRDVPKPMAKVNGRPFLEWQLDYLEKQGITRAILSIGYKGQIILNHFGNKYKNIEIIYAQEASPLGTGGALFNALELIETEYFFLMNGDTLFPIDLDKMVSASRHLNCPTVAMATFCADQEDRYGGLDICSKSKRLLRLKSAKSRKGQPANGGIYFCKRSDWIAISQRFPKLVKISFEDEVIPFLCKEEYNVATINFDVSLIDIGTVQDYEKANSGFLE